MTLPTTGAMSIAMINLELGREAGAPFSLDGAQERKLADREEGAISLADFYGQSHIIREPPEGEYFFMDASGYLISGFIHLKSSPLFTAIAWSTQQINNGMIMGRVDSYDFNGWRYHKGTYRSELSNSYLYGVYSVKL